MFSLFVFFGFNTYRAFGWGNRHAFPPYAAGPQPNRRLVTRNAITSRIHSVPNTPTSRKSFPHSAQIRDSLHVPYFRFLFLPSSISASSSIDFCFFFHRFLIWWPVRVVFSKDTRLVFDLSLGF
ncbi:hypothetical protein ES332_D12G195300v1 [Gossypium tomentosum]|uniref:Uncharacterized protein n=1 Tax=Gossypium tomentosum TaxID=34277 RepID=A0A5D2ICS3_GOSTO|nr:hypothetical protein ES332_D12G195300v1 [Gossypium tomentosum]